MAIEAAAPSVASQETWRLSVHGVVQGVGFRPFVHRLANRLRLGGWVRNEAATVEIVLTGTGASLGAFVAALEAEAPPLARIDAVTVDEWEVESFDAFEIVTSHDDRCGRQPISPDVATCAACERDLYEATDRRAGYPFITCTDCGPRHSVILGMPYDRERTTMRAFRPCAECRREYDDIDNRRYHSETNACAVCGPGVQLLDPAGENGVSSSPIEDAARLLREGAIVAVKGIGGFHLAVDATSESAVRRLRDRKHRDGKPLAIMVRRLGDAGELAHISPVEARWLASPERPILVLQAKDPSPLAPSITDGLATVGIMLAYSPLHMLLLDAVRRPLVMTSGNPANRPLASTLEEARETLEGIADAYLTHDRDIAVPIDDSVARVANGELMLMRRARGFAPLPVLLPLASPVPLLAVGAHLKNTFTLVHGGDAFVSQHIGDLETLETRELWERSTASFSRMLRFEPRVAVRDFHPEYVSTQLATQLGTESVIAVQHHHAHVAAVAAEHGVTGSVLGVAFDGTGYGDDGQIWGGELLVADLTAYRRVAHLRYAPLPGGDAAARHGWRAAVGYAWLAGDEAKVIEQALADVPAAHVRVARQACERGLNAPLASSMGRLFDAAAAILGICRHSRFEGEAAMRLEAAAGEREGELLSMPVVRELNDFIVDPVPLLVQLSQRVVAGDDPRDLAAAFHETVACRWAALVTCVARLEQLDTVALGGGVFQNARLVTRLADLLSNAGLRVLTARALPPNDGGISYGQAAVAAARLRA